MWIIKKVSAWCYVRLYSNKSSDVRNIYPEIVGYEVWIFAIFLILPVINIATFCGVQYKLRRVRNHGSALRYQASVLSVDLKLIFVPTILILLRIWSSILDFQVFFLQNKSFPQSDGWAVVIVFAGIGDSAQGLANAILFCALTKPVRNKLWKSLKSWCYGLCNCLRHGYIASESGWEPMRPTSDLVAEEPTTQFNESWELSRVGGVLDPLVTADCGEKTYDSVSCTSTQVVDQ